LGRGSTQFVEKRALLIIGLNGLGDLVDRPSRDTSVGLFTELPRCRADGTYRGSGLAGPIINIAVGIILFVVTVTAIRTAVSIFDVRRPIREEYTVEEIIVDERPITVVIRIRPERVIKNVRVGVGPIDWAIPWYEGCTASMSPSIAGRPMLASRLPPLIVLETSMIIP